MKCASSLILIITFVFSSHVNSQEIIPRDPNCSKQKATAECDKGWFTVSIGGDSHYDLSASLNGNYGREHFWRVGLTGKGLILADEYAYSLDLLRGISLVKRAGRFSVAGGLSLISYTVDDSEDDRESTAGVTLVAESFFTPFVELGVGFDIICTLSPEVQSIGIRFVLGFEGHK